MIIIGADYHPSFQQIALVDTETGALEDRQLQHREEAEKFYRHLGAQRASVRVEMKVVSSTNCRLSGQVIADDNLQIASSRTPALFGSVPAYGIAAEASFEKALSVPLESTAVVR